MLIDTHQRIHNYLRISLTDACNFRCFYCMPEEEVEVTPQSKLMSAVEILSIAKTFVSLGVNKIRLTGGEPLVRKDFAEIVLSLAKLPVKLTLTTNGVLLNRYTELLQEAGIHSVNVSLDTLNPNKFLVLTKRDQFAQVKQNIDTLIEKGFSVKVNVVTLKGINTQEINDFVEWTREAPVHVRFIEFMPFDRNQWNAEKVFTYHRILEVIREQYDCIKLPDAQHDTTKKYMVTGHVGTFAVISTMTAPFCSSCNRLRLTADGKMKNCLFSKTESDLLSAYRRGEDLEPLIRENLALKEKGLGGQLLPDFTQIDTTELANRSMISIGG